MEISNQTSVKKKEINLSFKESKYATGRRKKSIARVWLQQGNGNIFINGKKIIDYFKKPNLQTTVFRPLKLVKKENEIDIKCTVKGGGSSGQAGAIVHGISRALVLLDPELRKTLKKQNFTTRDSRTVERKKYGHRKARRSFQFSKR